VIIMLAVRSPTGNHDSAMVEARSCGMGGPSVCVWEDMVMPVCRIDAEHQRLEVYVAVQS
jgi:hypothetical protein